MEKIDVNELCNEAGKMRKFFKAFEKIDEVLITLQNSDAVIKQLQGQIDTIVALQDIEAPDPGILVRLLEGINSTGRRYSYAVAATIGRDPQRRIRLYAERYAAQ